MLFCGTSWKDQYLPTLLTASCISFLKCRENCALFPACTVPPSHTHSLPPPWLVVKICLALWPTVTLPATALHSLHSALHHSSHHSLHHPYHFHCLCYCDSFSLPPDGPQLNSVALHSRTSLGCIYARWVVVGWGVLAVTDTRTPNTVLSTVEPMIPVIISTITKQPSLIKSVSGASWHV